MISNRSIPIIMFAASLLLLAGDVAKANTSETSSIKYATVCANTQRLEAIGADLRTAFASDFRQSGVYRKLAWNAGKLKRQSARLHRQGQNKSDCRWDRQIGRLDKVVCSLEELTTEAHTRIARHIDPACHGSVVDVDNMLREAKELILGLHVATGTVITEFQTDRVIIEQQTPSFEVAPNFDPSLPPATEFGPLQQTPLPLENNPLENAPWENTPSINSEFPAIPEIPMEVPLVPPLESPSLESPSLGDPFGTPSGAIIVPEGGSSTRSPRSVLNRNPILVDPPLTNPVQLTPAYDGPPLTGPLETRSDSYDTAKALKKLNSK